MHSDPKRDAQKTEDQGLLAQPEEAPSVAKPDARGEEGIEAAEAAAKERERLKQIELKKNEGVKIAEKGGTAPAKVPPPTPSRQDRLDLERAAGEGMPPPSNP